MWVYLFALLIGVGFHFLIRYFSRNPDFLKKPLKEQRTTKKKMLWSVYGGLAFGCLLAFLMQNGFTSWARYLPAIVYLLIFVGGFYLCWHAYVLGVRRDFSKLEKSDGKFFTQPQKLLTKFALINLAAGISLLLVGIAISILKIELQRWGVLLVLVLACRKFLLTHFENTDEASGS